MIRPDPLSACPHSRVMKPTATKGTSKPAQARRHPYEFDSTVDFTRVNTEHRIDRLMPAEHDAHELDGMLAGASIAQPMPSASGHHFLHV